MTPRTRRGVVAAAVVLQAGVLVVGGLVLFREVRHQLAMAIRDQILSDSARAAEQFSAMIERSTPLPPTFGSEAWERLQEFVEGIDLPGEGFVCLLDAEGHILCHPEMRREPSLREINLGEKRLVVGRERRSVALGQAGPETVAGHASFLIDGVHYIAAREIPSMGVRLLVHQPESGLLALGSAASGGLMAIAMIGGLAILSLTALATGAVVRRYDSILERINHELEDEVARRIRQSLETRNALIFGLAKLADYRDSDTGAHLDRICAYSTLLAEALQDHFPEIDAAWIRDLRLAASLHDIGKVGIADGVLLKPGPLSAEERRRMQRHAVIGADTLIAIRERLGDDPLLNLAIQVALQHHERWDGTGYPCGLRGEEIAPAARIVALADVYDALTSHRVYKDSQSHQAACEAIERGRGTQFDPAVVDAFGRVHERFDQVRAAMPPGGRSQDLSAA